jgi:hypothetical protein
VKILTVVFWVVTSCSLVQENTASQFRIPHSFIFHDNALAGNRKWSKSRGLYEKVKRSVIVANLLTSTIHLELITH